MALLRSPFRLSPLDPETTLETSIPEASYNLFTSSSLAADPPPGTAPRKRKRAHSHSESSRQWSSSLDCCVYPDSADYVIPVRLESPPSRRRRLSAVAKRPSTPYLYKESKPSPPHTDYGYTLSQAGRPRSYAYAIDRASERLYLDGRLKAEEQPFNKLGRVQGQHERPPASLKTSADDVARINGQDVGASASLTHPFRAIPAISDRPTNPYLVEAVKLESFEELQDAINENSSKKLRPLRRKDMHSSKSRWPVCEPPASNAGQCTTKRARPSVQKLIEFFEGLR